MESWNVEKKKNPETSHLHLQLSWVGAGIGLDYF